MASVFKTRDQDGHSAQVLDLRRVVQGLYDRLNAVSKQQEYDQGRIDRSGLLEVQHVLRARQDEVILDQTEMDDQLQSAFDRIEKLEKEMKLAHVEATESFYNSKLTSKFTQLGKRFNGMEETMERLSAWYDEMRYKVGQMETDAFKPMTTQIPDRRLEGYAINWLCWCRDYNAHYWGLSQCLKCNAKRPTLAKDLNNED